MSLNVSFLSSPSYSTRFRSGTLHIRDHTQSKAQWRLPPELFSVIFRHTCPTLDIFVKEPIHTLAFHLVLRLVSRLWYNIVQSTPQLWASVILPKLCAENVDVKGRFLKLCLDNSGCLPLTLSIRFDPGLRAIACFVSPIVDATLEHNVHRIRTLELSQPPRSWLEILIPKMCQLDTIRIDNLDPYSPNPLPHRRDRQLILPKAASLSQISLSYPYLLDFSFECAVTSLTYVTVSNLPIDFVFEILLQCHNLIDFHCLFPHTESEGKNPRTMLSSPLVLNYLTSFTWSTTLIGNRHIGLHLSEWDCVLFERIHFPALERFSYLPSSFLPNDTTSASLLSRFPNSVTTLDLLGLKFYSQEDISGMEMFSPLTGVIELRLVFCGKEFVEEIFSVLLHDTDESNTLFPELTSIVIDYPAVKGKPLPYPTFGPGSGKKLTQMLRSRIGLVDEFTLIVESAYLTQNWDDEVWHSLRELVEEGLNLTIIEHGHPIMI